MRKFQTNSSKASALVSRRKLSLDWLIFTIYIINLSELIVLFVCPYVQEGLHNWVYTAGDKRTSLIEDSVLRGM